MYVLIAGARLTAAAFQSARDRVDIRRLSAVSVGLVSWPVMRRLFRGALCSKQV